MDTWNAAPAPSHAWATAPRADDAWSGASADAGNQGSGAVHHNGKENDGNGGDFAKGGDAQETSSFAGGFGEAADTGDASAGKCFNCGELGHRAADCPTPRDMTCRYCKQPGHFLKDCPDKPPVVCENCGQEGHMKYSCENARKINRDHVATISPEDAWAKIQRAVKERDMDDAKEAVQEYIKALDGAVTYRDLQEGLINDGINLFLIATERPLANVFTNMDLQGNMGKRYTISYRFSEKPDRPREAESFPKSREELLARLVDAGEVVNSGRSLCHNCGEVGHISKQCPQEVMKPERPKISCSNCGEESHRLRDCPQPRVDRFACRNCGKSGHRAAECEEPPNYDDVECRRCNEKGHMSRDCPQAGPRGCRNCGQEGHMAKECDQPRNMDNVTCRNCEKTGHMSRDCPEPKDWSKVQCSNCQQYGHTKVRCQQPVAEAEASNDGGFNEAWPGGESAGGDEGTAATFSAGGW